MHTVNKQELSTAPIAEILVVIQNLLDARPVAEQAQARAFVDARYPSIVSLIGDAHGGVHEPVQRRVHKPVHAPILDKVVSSFLKFWSEYPKKTGKQEALRIWKRIKPSEELEVRILAAVRQQKDTDDWTKEDGRYIPHPKTWLNQCRWEDEPVQKRGSLAQRLWAEGSANVQP